jgi:hypothetical protein
MHPRTFIDGCWRNDIAAEVFVAMSFSSKYDARWLRIFKPAIEEWRFDGVSLGAEARRKKGSRMRPDKRIWIWTPREDVRAVSADV